MTKRQRSSLAKELIQCMEDLSVLAGNGNDQAVREVRRIIVEIIVRLTSP